MTFYKNTILHVLGEFQSNFFFVLISFYTNTCSTLCISAIEKSGIAGIKNFIPGDDANSRTLGFSYGRRKEFVWNLRARNGPP